MRAGFPALAVLGAPLQVITHSLSERSQGGYLHRLATGGGDSLTAADSNTQLFDLSSSQNWAPLLLGHCTQQEIFTACVSSCVSQLVWRSRQFIFMFLSPVSIALHWVDRCPTTVFFTLFQLFRSDGLTITWTPCLRWSRASLVPCVVTSQFGLFPIRSLFVAQLR